MHFTYSSLPTFTTLRQGDVLEKTDEIASVLSSHHPYFTKEQYKYFIVITQSCDLERRDNKSCNSPYITLAAIRTLDEFIERASKKMKMSEINGIKVLPQSQAEKFRQLLERLYSNSEDGYFLLPSEPESHFEKNMVAYLKVSIALKSDEHYPKCLSAKRLELADEFKAKLGWMVGTMYSRVGTKDWLSIMSKSDYQAMLNSLLNQRFIISEDQKLPAVKKTLETLETDIEDLSKVQDIVNSITIETKYDKLMKELENIIMQSKVFINDQGKSVLIKKLQNSTTIRSNLK